jgi:hypothetical protein
MEFRLIRRLVGEKLLDRSTYVVAAVVGTLINVYGQLLVPWLRGAADPFAVLTNEFQERPALTVFSIFLGYAFPVFVGTYASVATRYKTRRFESVADFPDRKPDPVFRAARSGRIVEVGAATREFFEQYQVDAAQKILGEKVWAEIVSKRGPGNSGTVYFEAEGVSYIVSYAPTADDHVNVYLTRLPAA